MACVYDVIHNDGCHGYRYSGIYLTQVTFDYLTYIYNVGISENIESTGKNLRLQSLSE